MSSQRLLPLIVAGLIVALVLPACGGGGGYRNDDGSGLTVLPSSIPPRDSGQFLDFQVPIQGGCGGPYVMQVLSGRLPPGLYLDEASHSIKGYLLEHGDYSFTIQVTDTGCNPFSSTTQDYEMSVGQGEITVVDMKRDGQIVGLIPPGEGDHTFSFPDPVNEGQFIDIPYTYNPDYPAMPKTVFNSPVNFDLICAGGAGGPYRVSPVDTNDGQSFDGLPLGVSVILNSASLSGAPGEEGPEITLEDTEGTEYQVGGPFTLAFEITDKAGNKGYWECNWLIYSPPLVVVTKPGGIKDGTCGEVYSDSFQIAGGVGPFAHELTNPRDGDAKATNTVYPPLNHTGGGTYNYASTHPGAPPEGIYLDDVIPAGATANRTASLQGLPRRRGTFELHYHAYALLAPTAPSQNGRLKTVFRMAVAAPVVQDASYTLDGPNFAGADPYNRIPDFEVGGGYNPDGGPDGLSFLASGGVPYDGKPDYPHASQVDDPMNAVPEIPGSYDWQMNWAPAGENANPGDPSGPISGAEFLVNGILRVADANLLKGQGWQVLEPAVYTQQLPISGGGYQASTEKVRVSVGPDFLLITRSSKSFQNSTYSSGAYYGDNTGMNDDTMTLMLVSAGSSGFGGAIPIPESALTGEGSSQHKVPIASGSGTLPVATLLTNVDLLRASTNPTGWWDDSFNMNPKAARGLYHGDLNNSQYYNNLGYQYNYSYAYQSGSYSYSYAYGRGAQPESTAVDLPVCSASVTHDPDQGIYTDGGRMYPFDSSKYFGIFIVREDGRIYVPLAFDKSASGGYVGFGDQWAYKWQGKYPEGLSNAKLPQITVSPDGRYAAVKLLKDLYTFTRYSSYFYEYQYTPSYLYTYQSGDSYWKVTNGDTASTSKIAIFSLTGERSFSSQPSKIVSTGSTGSTTGEYLYGASLALTNDQLYYLCGTQSEWTSGSYRWGYDQHTGRNSWIYRYDVTSSATAGSLLDFPGTENTSGNPLQVPFGMFQNSIYSYAYSYSSGTYAYSYSYSYTENPLQYDAANWTEASTAPTCFRASADGSSMGILAGPATDWPADASSGAPSSSEYWMYHVWVDRSTGGTPVLEQLSTEARHTPNGAGRGSMTRRGPRYMDGYSWGVGTGPTTHFEISDDGTRAAIVHNTTTASQGNQYFYRYQYNGSSYSYTYGYPYPGYNWWAREDIVAFDRNTDGTWDEIEVTGGTNPTFATSPRIVWRFGSLTFTEAGDGFVFWGGLNNYDPDASGATTATSRDSFQNAGSLFSYKFSDDLVRHILDEDDGGMEDAVGTEYDGTTSSDRVGKSSWTGTGYKGYCGVITPVGSFLSKNRKFLYMMTRGAVNDDDDLGRTQHQLIGVNIESLDDGDSINGHPGGEAFRPGDWPERRGFVWDYNGNYSTLYNYYGTNQYYTPNGQSGTVKMSRDSGRVFFAGHYQESGASNYVTSYSYGGPTFRTYFTAYFPGVAELYVFDADVGGDVTQLSDLGGTKGTYSSTTRRAIPYIQPSRDGSEVSYVYASNYQSYSYSWINFGAESLGYVGGILMDQYGDVTQSTDFDNILSASANPTGRVSSSVANGPLGGVVYYGYGTSLDEKDKQLYKVTPGTNPSGTGGTMYRYNVLHAYR